MFWETGARYSDLLVDDHEALVVSFADLLLEFDDFLDSAVDEGAFSRHQLLTLYGRLVEESRIDLSD